MTQIITYQKQRWLVNNKRWEDLNFDEQNALDDYFREFKELLLLT